MTKHGWAPGWRLNAEGRWIKEREGALTQEELWDLDKAFDLWWAANPLKHPMPVLMRHKIRRLIVWALRQCPWSQEQKQMARWWAAYKFYQRHGGLLKEAFTHAEKRLHGTPAQAKWSTIKKDYEEIERLRRAGKFQPPKLPKYEFGTRRPRR